MMKFLHAKPKALDLFCGAGGATKGLQRAGFYVVGMDIQAQPRYCGDEFIQADALAFPLEGYDFIWASPPCQRFSVAANVHKNRGKQYPDFLTPVRARLEDSGIPFVVENVVGAPLISHVLNLCGTMFGLAVFRHRLFQTSWLSLQPRHQAHTGRIGEGFYSVAGGAGRWKNWSGVHRNILKGTREEWRNAMGIEWMTRHELTQAIPPAYSEFIGKQAMQFLNRE